MPVAAFIREEIEIPENITIDVDGSEVIVKSGGKELRRTLSYPNVSIKKEDNKIVIESSYPRKNKPQLLEHLHPISTTW